MLSPGHVDDKDLEKALIDDTERNYEVSERALNNSNPSESWMSQIADKTLLSALTIPGTHDSCAYTLSFPFIQTQTLDINKQLQAGIRYFDFRCGLRDDVVEMVHGSQRLGMTLIQVLDMVYQWLDTHPSEGLIIQMKEDRKPEKSTFHFSRAIMATISSNSSYWRISDRTPTLAQLRGRIQLFRRFPLSQSEHYGIDVTRWQDNPLQPFTIFNPSQQLTIQDHYSFTTPAALPAVIAQKGGDISSLLTRACDDEDGFHWYINYTSAVEFNFWHQLSPREIAVGGYSGFQWEPGINPRLKQFLIDAIANTAEYALDDKDRHDGVRRYGIVVMDFPEAGTDDLIETLIATNVGKAKEYRTLKRRQPVVTLYMVIIIVLAVLHFKGHQLVTWFLAQGYSNDHSKLWVSAMLRSITM